MSDTPRTNEFYLSLYKSDVPPEMIDIAAGRERDFARQLERELADLRAKLEAAERDAERYRWLRNRAGDEGVVAGNVRYWSEEYSAQAGFDLLDGAELDAVIDAVK